MSELRTRENDYKERLSSRMLLAACITALFVLLDPKVVVPIGEAGQVLTLGGAGFSLDIKGMVIGAIIIEGLKSIKEYWLGTSAGGQKLAESATKMAEAAAPSQALAVAAARAPAPDAPLVPPGADLKVGTMNVEANTANVTERKDP